jgi:hypothetical protein
MTISVIGGKFVLLVLDQQAVLYIFEKVQISHASKSEYQKKRE